MPTTPASATLPGLPSGEPPQPVVRTRAVRPTSEYVSGGGSAWLAAYAQALPRYIDDLSADLGPDIYEQMLVDDQVWSSVRTVNLGVLEDGYQLRPAVDDRDDPRYDGAKRWLQFCERCLDGLPSDNGFDSWLEDMLLATGLGHRVAEWTVRKEESGKDAGRLVLKCLKVKPRRTYTMVVDVFRNLVGLLGWIPGQAMPVMSGTILGEGQRGWILPREKFCVLSNSPRESDPRGTSILRAAYTPWWAKRQLWGRYLAYLAKFAEPSLVGKTPVGAQGATPLDADGNPTGAAAPSPEQVMLNHILAFQGGTAVVLPGGAELDALHIPGGDGPFSAALDRFDRAIAKAITLQTLATEEGKHQARAAAEVHQDTGGLSPRQLKQALARMVSKDLLYRLVLANATPAEARELSPLCTFSPTAQQDWTATAQVAASIGYQLDASQLPAMDERLGLPPRQPAEAQPGMDGEAQQPGASAGQDSRPGRDAPAKPEAKPGQVGRTSPGAEGSPKVPRRFPEGSPKGDEAGFAEDGPDLSGLDLSGLTRVELLALLAEAALAAHDPVAEFYDPEQPRVPAGQSGGGRWASGASAHVRDYARQYVRDFARRGGAPDASEAGQLAARLATLTVADLHALKKEHGLKASGKDKATLVKKLAERFAAHRAKNPPENPPAISQKDLTGQEKETILPSESSNPAGTGEAAGGHAMTQTQELPKLAGSDKQTAWAEEIRRQTLERVASTPFAPLIERAAVGKPDSRWWIDNRKFTADSLLAEALAPEATATGQALKGRAREDNLSNYASFLLDLGKAVREGNAYNVRVYLTQAVTPGRLAGFPKEAVIRHVLAAGVPDAAAQVEKRWDDED